MSDRQREITDSLNKWAHEYYVLDNPSVSDKEYDALYDELRKMEAESGVVYPDSPTRRVGGEPIKGFEKHTQIADVIVDGGNTNRFSEVSASLRVVLIFREIVDIEGVFSSLLEVIDVLANHVLCDLVDAINFKFVAQPSLE